AHGHSEHRHEEQEAEEQTPEHSVARPRADHVVVGRHLELAVLRPDDRSDRVGLDNEVLRESLCFFLRLDRGGLIGIADRNQFRHRSLLFRTPIHGRAGPATSLVYGDRKEGCKEVRTAQDYELQSSYAMPDYDSPKGAGWVTFAAVMLGLVAVWNCFDGILAISSSHVYTANSVFVFSD